MRSKRRAGEGVSGRQDADGPGGDVGAARGGVGAGAPAPGLLRALARLHEALESVGHPRAPEVAQVAALADGDAAAFWRAIDANAWWAGAGSLAAETMADNPGLGPEEWQAVVRELRELLSEIGETLLARGGCNPGISSWVLAFRNWNASGV